VPHWGLAYLEKGPARATKYFSGNGIAVAAMCAALHKHRPVVAMLGVGQRGKDSGDFGGWVRTTELHVTGAGGPF